LEDEDLSFDGMLGIKHEYPSFIYQTAPSQVAAVKEKSVKYNAKAKNTIKHK